MCGSERGREGRCEERPVGAAQDVDIGLALRMLTCKVGILGRYIPAKEFHRIKERAQYDEVVDEWHIPKATLHILCIVVVTQMYLLYL